jgi:hypothetical protein
MAQHLLDGLAAGPSRQVQRLLQLGIGHVLLPGEDGRGQRSKPGAAAPAIAETRCVGSFGLPSLAGMALGMATYGLAMVVAMRITPWGMER